jgi:probable F420-dependent oxidoreductase
VKFLFQYPDFPYTPGKHESNQLSSEVTMGAIATQRFGDLAVAVETSGFHGMSFTEHPAPSSRWLAAGGHQTVDPFAALAVAAAATSRIRLLSYLSVAPYRNPFLLGKSAATVDLISGGRFTLGVGAGYQRSEFAALGVDFDERNELVDETLDLLPAYWSGQPVEARGRHFSARDVVCAPAPIQQPIPIWMGGNSTVAMRRAARRCQGWMPMFTDPTLASTTRTAEIPDVAILAERISMMRRDAADRADDVDVLVTYPDIDIGRPETNIDDHRRRLAELERAGVTWIAVTAVPSSHDAIVETIEFMGRTYIG